MFKEEVINAVSLAGVKQGSKIVRHDSKTFELVPEGSSRLRIGLRLRDVFQQRMMHISDRQPLVLSDLQLMLNILEQQCAMALMGAENRAEGKKIAEEHGPKIAVLDGCIKQLEIVPIHS
ncbi:MAG: hypothetical protein AAB489_05935 [Patescibacteria group bacterium]